MLRETPASQTSRGRMRPPRLSRRWATTACSAKSGAAAWAWSTKPNGSSSARPALFIVVANADRSAHAVYYLPADLQQPEMFQQRRPLRATARRAGWVATDCGSTCQGGTSQYG